MNELLYSANAIPITPSNRLRLAFWNSDPDTAQTVLVLWRIQNKDGTISNNAEEVTVAASAAGQEAVYPLPYGELLAVTVSTFSTTLQNGELYAVIILQNGNVDDRKQKLPLISGYILANAPLAYPLGRVEAVNSGVPAMKFKSPTDPAAGNPFTFTPSITGYAALQVGIFTLTTDAAVADRGIYITLSSNGIVFWRAIAKTAQTAGLTITYIFSKTTKPADEPTNTKYIEIPFHAPIFNLAVDIGINNLQGGDQLSAMSFGYQLYTAI